MAEAINVIDSDDHKKKGGIGEFVRETRSELDRTTFPSTDDVKRTTVIVIVSVIFFAVYLFLIDHLWVYLLEGLMWLVDKIVGV